jgi:hypothetical protein
MGGIAAVPSGLKLLRLARKACIHSVLLTACAEWRGRKIEVGGNSRLTKRTIRADADQLLGSRARAHAAGVPICVFVYNSGDRFSSLCQAKLYSTISTRL